VEACILGQAVQAGSGANPALQAAQLAGLQCPGATLTLNQGRASGLQAIFLAARWQADLAVAGGMESSSRAPYLLPSARWGTRMGQAPVLDSLLLDARWPAAGGPEGPASPSPELVPMGTGLDEPAGPGEGPQPADGAAVVLLGSEAEAMRTAPLARIAGMACAGDEAGAVRQVLAGAGLTLQAMDLLDLDDPTLFPDLGERRCAPGGSALGADGARKVVTLAHGLHHGGLRRGLASLACDGAGLAILLERT
jgi:acetyl-CoA acetyltransferase